MTDLIKALGDQLEQQLDALEATNVERDSLTDDFRLTLNTIHMRYLIGDIALIRAAIKNLKVMTQ